MSRSMLRAALLGATVVAVQAMGNAFASPLNPTGLDNDPLGALSATSTGADCAGQPAASGTWFEVSWNPLTASPNVSPDARYAIKLGVEDASGSPSQNFTTGTHSENILQYPGLAYASNAAAGPAWICLNTAPGNGLWYAGGWQTANTDVVGIVVNGDSLSTNGNAAGSNTIHLQLPPVVSAITPATGATVGGENVVITGSHLAETSHVLFGSHPAAVIDSSDNKVDVTAPAGALGTVNVLLTTQGGGTSPAGSYTYVAAAPVISAVTPSAGPTIGNNTLSLSGRNLFNASSVLVGGAAATHVLVNADGTSLTATAPAGSVGTVDISVTTPTGTGTLPAAYTYSVVPVPVVTDVCVPTAAAGTTTKAKSQVLGTPLPPRTCSKDSAGNEIRPSGGTGASTQVLIVGSNLTGATGVVASGTQGKIQSISDDGTQIFALTPALSTPGTFDLQVANLGGLSPIVSADTITYVLSPSVVSISPNQGPAAGGTVVTINGAGFFGPGGAAGDCSSVTLQFIPAAEGTGYAATSNTGEVTWDPAGAASITCNSVSADGTSINATTPAAPPTDYDILVTTPYGTSSQSSIVGGSADIFTVNAS